MGLPPDENAARLERLERWTEEQRNLSVQRSILPREKLAQRIANRFLDHGLHTAGREIEVEHLQPDRVGYVPSAWRTLPRALRCVGASPDDTFVDFGCGKGRVVHQAAKRPFRRVIGVEISPALAAVARATVDARRQRYRCKDVEIVVADARDFAVPDDMTIAYFFHPFDGETLDAVLANVIESLDRNPRRVSLIYTYPRASDQVLATGRFRFVKELSGGFRARSARVYPTAIYESS